MASAFLPSVNPFIWFPSSSIKHNASRQLILCQAGATLTKRRSLSLCFVTSFVFSFRGDTYFDANAAILEADDDEELLERVKKDRKKRLERQGIINNSGKETGYLQDVVYRLSKIGQAIDNNDLSTASSVLGKNTNTDWVQKANIAFNKLTSSPEEKTEVDAFNSSLSLLISAVTRNDIESSKTAFVASATALEKWTALTGLAEQLKGF